MEKSIQQPRILLVGAGAFGRHYVRVLNELHEQGRICFVGLAVNTEESRQKWCDVVSTHTGDLEKIVIDLKIDGVFIVTPPDTHFGLVKKCLKYTNVFVEKPLALNAKDAQELSELADLYNRKLTTGHIFRFYKLTNELAKVIENKGVPIKIEGKFLNPIVSDVGRDIAFELLHMFDVVDLLFERDTEVVYSQMKDRLMEVDVRYKNLCDVHFLLGWTDNQKERELSLFYKDVVIKADFTTESLVYKTGDTIEERLYPNDNEPLHNEVVSFIDFLTEGRSNLVPPEVATRIVALAETATTNSIMQNKPRVAIIGGGIFGVSAALELRDFCEVTVFERNSELMQEGSFVNCYRHHMGHHYPRSDNTVKDIQNSRNDFESKYKEALRTGYPAYYSLAKEDSKVTSAEFIEFCHRNKLPCNTGFPDESILDRDLIQLSVKVSEPVYHFPTLKRAVVEQLSASGTITVRKSSNVTNYTLLKNGNKRLEYSDLDSEKKSDEFDYVVNATYANINNFTKALGFPKYPIRVDIAEVLVIELPIDPVSVTVIDGPFVSLVPTGNKNEFTLYHVTESILDRYVPDDGLIKPVSSVLKSNAEAIIQESMKYLPILKLAKVKESRITHRGVIAGHEHDDARVSEVISHGFGCWSVLSGKILSSVSLAKKIAKEIKS